MALNGVGSGSNGRGQEKQLLSPPPALGRMAEDDESEADREARGGNAVAAGWEGTSPHMSHGGQRGRQGRYGSDHVGDEGQREGGEVEDERFMRDAGLVGILQQIVATGGGIGR